MESKYRYKGIPINKLTRDKEKLKLWTSRIFKGWNVERAVETPKLRKNEFKHYYKGEPAVLVAARNGIDKGFFYSRITRGFSIEEACTMPKRKTKKQIEWEKNKNDRIK